MTSTNKKTKPGILKDANGKIILGTKQEPKKYINELFEDDNEVPKILKELKSLKTAKNMKLKE